ncbi:MAG: hypothetical protein WCG85_27880, partial [Polyangia bacterium]
MAGHAAFSPACADAGSTALPRGLAAAATEAAGFPALCEREGSSPTTGAGADSCAPALTPAGGGDPV